ncbi:MAG: preprotein translocase subunit SecY [Gammaproteobacteria bacterium]
MIQKFRQLMSVPETRDKIVTTLALLLAYRAGFHIPIPGTSPDFLRSAADSAASTVFGVMNAFSGGAIGQTAIFSLGIMPYISASIIFSVLGKVSPAIEAIQKEGAAGQKKINQWTRLSTVPICLIQALFVWFGVFSQTKGILSPNAPEGVMMALVVIVSLTAGALFVMWLGELITEHGIGNGASLIIMGGIISSMPSSLLTIFRSGQDFYGTVLTLVSIWVTIVVVVVYMQKGERRIPIQYARLTRGRRVYGGQKHFLPLKINMAGVMPIIFASALFMIPGVVFKLLGMNYLGNVFTTTDGFIYVTFYLLMVFWFCFFWNNLMFQPTEIANNLREHGSFIPGIRPGVRTADYIKGSLKRITLAGAAFLALIAVVPNFVTANIPELRGSMAYFLGGTSVLIVVGVAMDMVDKLNSQLTMHNYEGFMKTGGGAAWAKRGQKK